MAKELEARLSNLTTVIRAAADKAKIAGVNYLKARYTTRIFTEGRKTDGGGIGRYSTTPTYVSIAGSRAKYGSQVRTSALSPRGKNSTDSTFKNGRSRKSQYFEDGYAGFRAQVGRQTERVDLNLTGNLRDSVEIGTRNNGLGIEIRDGENARLSQQLESKYGNVFEPSDKEVEEVLNEVEEVIFDEILKALS